MTHLIIVKVNCVINHSFLVIKLFFSSKVNCKPAILASGLIMLTVMTFLKQLMSTWLPIHIFTC